MNIHNINTIAHYEVKLLRRSWLFRIFAILTLIGITGLLLFEYSNALNWYTEAWSKMAISSLLPFTSTYFYNIAQSIIVVFLAGSFLKRDKKLDTAEVIYVRPMSNADYIIGKTWGIMKVFISLNIIILLITAFINIVLNHSPFSVFPYLFYLTTISIPSLLFILGLSFTAMCLLKNQAVTFIVMLGFIGMVFFYLNEHLNGVFDFFGVNIPSIFSDEIGHAYIGLFLLQRLIYLLIGIGLISFTIALVNRLPHRPWKVIIVNMIGVFFVLAGCFAGLLYILHYNHIDNLQNTYIQSYNNYENTEKVNIIVHEIKLETSGDQITSESIVKVKNNNPGKLENIILYLNPALKISTIEENGATLPFNRENQVISIQKELNAGEEFTFTLKYSGKIDENICYLDITKEKLADTKVSNEYHRFGKRYAYLDSKYTLLTPEIIWYPVSYPPVNPAAPYRLSKDFTDYKLTVVNPDNKTVLSQGESTQSGTNITFTNRTPLTGISLTIADYEKKALTIDSITYEIYNFKGHDFYSQYFTEIQDTLPAIIRDFKNDQEVAKKRTYPFNKFILAETPVHFASYVRTWKGNTEYIMPEIVFIPERGATISANFETNKQWMKRGGRRENQEELDEKEIQLSIFRKFLSDNLTNETIQQRWNWENQTINKYSISSLFFGYTNFIYSGEYPIFDIAINTMQNPGTTEQRGWWGGGVINDRQRANLYLGSNSFKIATEDKDIKPEIFYELLKLKSNALKNYIIAQVPAKELEEFLINFSKHYQFQKVGLDEFLIEFKERFNIDLSDFIQKWYTENRTPALSIKDVDANKILIDDFTKYQIRFKAYNSSDIDAIISVQIIEGGGQGRGGRRGGGGARRMNLSMSTNTNNSFNYIIPAGTAQEIKIINDERPANIKVETNISRNLPTTHTFNFAKIDNTISDTTSGVTNIDIALFAPNANEIIIDNEDAGFKTIESNTKHKLKDLFKKEEKEKYKNLAFWRFPTKWTAIAAASCYGTIIHSAVYKSRGNGANAVVWSTEIPQDGYYEISIWNPKLGQGGRFNHGEKEDRTQTYVINYDGKHETIPINLEEEEEGWVSLGNFYLPQGEANVKLTDKVANNFVVADAVKFTKVEE